MVFLIIVIRLAPFIVTTRASMTVPFRAFTLVPMLLPFFVAVAPFLLLNRFRLAIGIMTMPGFNTPFMNLMPFRISVTALHFHNVWVRIKFFNLSVSGNALRKRCSVYYAER